MSTTMSRRHAIRLTAIAAAAPLVSVWSRATPAGDAPLIAESDPAAKAVSYVEDAARAKTAKPGSTCANCALYQAPANTASGPCALFPGKQVKAAGWCSAWSAKA